MKQPSGVPRALLPVLCLCGLSANVSGRSVDPLMTLIADDFGVGVATTALLASCYSLPFALGQPVLGPLGDTYGKSWLMRLALCGLAGCLLGAALAPSISLLFALRFCAGLAAGGVIPACMATIGDRFPPDRRQVAISRFVTIGLLAQIFAASASGGLASVAGWRVPVLVTAAFAACAALAATFWLPGRSETATRFSATIALANYRSVFRNPKAVLCYGTVFMEGLGLYGILPYVAPILRKAGEGGAREAGIIIAGLGGGGLLYALSLPLLVKRLDRPRMMALGGLLMLAGPLALASALHWMLAALGFLVAGFGFMLLHNSIQTEVVELAPAARQSAYSLHAFSFFSGQAAGPPVFGLLLALLPTGAALSLCAAVLAATGLVASARFRRML